MSPVLILSWDQPIMVTCAMLSNASEFFKTMLSLPELTLHFFAYNRGLRPRNQRWQKALSSVEQSCKYNYIWHGSYWPSLEAYLGSHAFRAFRLKSQTSNGRGNGITANTMGIKFSNAVWTFMITPPPCQDYGRSMRSFLKRKRPGVTIDFLGVYNVVEKV